MPLTDYTSFKASVVEFLHRGEVTASSTILDDCIDLAEAELSAELRTRQQEDYTQVASTSGYLVHPTDWVAHKAVSLVSGSKKYDLTPYSEESGVVQLGGSGSTTPSGYVVRGDKTWLLPSTSSGTGYMVYYKAVPALSTSATTNWLLTSYPHVYLGYTLKWLAAWGYDDARIPGIFSAAQDAVAKLNNASKLASYGQAPQSRPDRTY